MSIPTTLFANILINNMSTRAYERPKTVDMTPRRRSMLDRLANRDKYVKSKSDYDLMYHRTLLRSDTPFTSEEFMSPQDKSRLEKKMAKPKRSGYSYERRFPTNKVPRERRKRINRALRRSNKHRWQTVEQIRQQQQEQEQELRQQKKTELEERLKEMKQDKKFNEELKGLQEQHNQRIAAKRDREAHSILVKQMKDAQQAFQKGNQKNKEKKKKGY